MIRSIRLFVFVCILALAHGAHAQGKIGIRSHDDVGWLRGLDNAHVLVLEIYEDGGKCGLTTDIAEQEFASSIRAIPVTVVKEDDEVDNIFFLGLNTIYEKGLGLCTTNLSVEFYHNSVFYHAGLDEIVPDIINIWSYDMIFDSIRKNHGKTLKKVISKVAEIFDKDWKADNQPATASTRVRSRGIIRPHSRSETMGKGFGKPSSGLSGKDMR
jgi:hypothetical protein